MTANGLYARLYEEQYGAQQAGVPQDVQTNRLRRVPLFTDLPPEILAAVASRLQMERFADGDTIIHQGDMGDKFYMIDRGQVEITIGNSQLEKILLAHAFLQFLGCIDKALLKILGDHDFLLLLFISPSRVLLTNFYFNL